MLLAHRVGKNSLIYTITEFSTKGISFLLLPLYTFYLTPADYGILAIVTSINSFLAIFLTFSLQGAMNRFYFEYREEPEKLRAFWGTIITFILIVSFFIGSFLLLLGKHLIQPFIGQVLFYPFIVIGLLTIMIQPVVNIYLCILQAKERAKHYAIISLTSFFLNVMITIALVVLFGWGALGPLTAGLIIAVLFFILSMYLMRKDIKFGIHKGHLKKALKYSLPIVPHSLAGQIINITDKLFLNHLINLASAGLYNIGFLFGSIISMVSISINRAYAPASFDVRKSGDKVKLDELKEFSLFLVVFYCFLASSISIYSSELILFFTTKSFYSSYIVVPFIAFAFVLNGIYYILVNILFYVKHATKFVSIGTGVAAISNIFMNLYFIQRWGLMGAAWATLLSQFIGTIIIGFIGKHFEVIKWQYNKFLFLFLVSASVSISLNMIGELNFWILITIKTFVLILLFFVLSILAWMDPFFLFRRGKKLIGKLIWSRNSKEI